jgi:hypothetical protein
MLAGDIISPLVPGDFKLTYGSVEISNALGHTERGKNVECLYRIGSS